MVKMKPYWIGILCIAFIVIIFEINSNRSGVYEYNIGGYYMQERNATTSRDLERRGSSGQQEVHHIYFLKIHKSGSTSMQNIFLRFALARNLNVLTLFNGRFKSYPFLTFDEYLPRATPKGLVNGRYDIYTEHSIYDEEYLLTKLHEDTVNIAIIREPMSQLRSSFEFYHMDKRLQLTRFPDPVAEYLRDPEYYSNNTGARSVTYNRVSKEFGYLPSSHQLKEYLEYIESKFLVLIMEKLPESLIVMKRKLCWDMKDIIVAKSRQANYTKPKVNETLVKLHKAWSPLDYAFYDYFTHVMDQTIAAQDNGFHGEVSLFEDYLSKTREFCDDVCASMGTLVRPRVDRESITSLLHSKTRFAESRWNSGFDITGLDCLMMRVDPSIFRDIQKVRLFPEYCSDDNPTEAAQYVNTTYCEDLFDEIIPWPVLRKPRFATTCY